MQQLSPKAVWLFFIELILAWIFLVPFLFLFFVPFIAVGFGFFKLIKEGPFTLDISSLKSLLSWLWVIIPAIPVASWVQAKLTYRFYRYELREEGFRKEHGIVWKTYVTIPYNRIQNIDIYRGVIDRLLGLSDLHIQTAGASVQFAGSRASGRGAEGGLPGLSREVAEQLRDELIKRAQQSKNQGL